MSWSESVSVKLSGSTPSSLTAASLNRLYSASRLGLRGMSLLMGLTRAPPIRCSRMFCVLVIHASADPPVWSAAMGTMPGMVPCSSTNESIAAESDSMVAFVRIARAALVAPPTATSRMPASTPMRAITTRISTSVKAVRRWPRWGGVMDVSPGRNPTSGYCQRAVTVPLLYRAASRCAVSSSISSSMSPCRSP